MASQPNTPSLQSLLRPFRPPCLLPIRKRTLWGQPHMVRPALVKETFGNGKRLIGLMPIMHRPWYYLVWIDDQWDLENSSDQWIDKLEEIWDEIGAEFGTRDPEGNDYVWPEEDSSGGCSWFTADAADVLPPSRLRKLRRRNG